MQSIYANIVARVYQAGELTHSVSVVCPVRGAEPRPPNVSVGVRAYMSAHSCCIIACYAREI